jgi:hypothetical protein
MIRNGSAPDRIGIIYNQVGCYWQLMSGNPKEQFELAVKYFTLAQKNGIDKIEEMLIQDIIRKLSLN